MSDTPGYLTVVVPTYNRLDTLYLCLKALEKQTLSAFKVIVINDGSTDGTEEALAEIQQKTSLQLRVMHQKNAGPARARNVAIGQVSTDLCLLIGDDIVASPGLLEAHVRFHRANPEPGAVGLGWTKWDEVYQQLTPFMTWYENIQFGYNRLLAGDPPTWQYFYTSNLSFKTRLVQTNPFDERFRAAAWEDIELGFRLFRAGTANLMFLPDAIATHIHPTTFSQAIKRMQTLGKSEYLFHQLWPDARITQRGLKSTICAFLAKQPFLLHLFTQIAQHAKPGKLHAMLLRSYAQRGYFQASR